MRVADIIRAKKSDLDFGGKWREDTIPASQWPVSRHGRALGRGWKWRFAKFKALDQKFKVLIALSEEKEYYRAVLGWFADDGFRVLCHHELHSSHFGWHCHFYDGDVSEIEPKKTRDRETVKLWPTFSNDKCGVDFTINEKSAMTKAAERYRLYEDNEGLLL